MRIHYLMIFFFFLLSCNRRVVIPATKDASLLSSYPDENFSGKRITGSMGLGSVKIYNGNYYTYPAMYLGSGNPDSIKDAFVIGGFNFSSVKREEIVSACLKFYINYSSSNRNNVIFFVRPVLKEWDENTVCYHSFFKDSKTFSALLDIIESDEKKCKIVSFDIKLNEEKKIDEIPYSSSYKEVVVDITDIVKNWIDYPKFNNGLLVDPMWMTDLRYVTSNEGGELSNFGIIEVATCEWYFWDGKVTEKSNVNYSDIRNKAYKKLKYIPRIELILKN